MEFSDVINKRRTTRQFTGQPVAKEIIERIIDAGNMRKWNFIVVTNSEVKAKILDTIKALPCSIDEPKNPFQEMVKIAFPKQRTMFEESSCIILPIYQGRSFWQTFYGFCGDLVRHRKYFLGDDERRTCLHNANPDSLSAADCPEIGIGHAAQIYPKLSECIHRNKF